MAKKPNGQADILEALGGRSELDKPIDAVQAQAAIDADKQARAREYGEILTREGQRLRCDLVAVAEIVGNQVATKVIVIPK